MAVAIGVSWLHGKVRVFLARKVLKSGSFLIESGRVYGKLDFPKQPNKSSSQPKMIEAQSSASFFSQNR